MFSAEKHSERTERPRSRVNKSNGKHLIKKNTLFFVEHPKLGWPSFNCQFSGGS